MKVASAVIGILGSSVVIFGLWLAWPPLGFVGGGVLACYAAGRVLRG